ncbi:MAG TPA: VWA domain-containing protein [Planctomycetota bacterium]|nr:VWA domain-containing protein [Planctomycetota bacterium]
MNGLTTLNPWYLVGLAAALVPLVIHLIERHRVQRVVFGSVLFLRGLVKRVARRRRTSELILLLLRMALLAVLALAFSRPFFREADVSGSGDSAGGRRAAAILVDVSASMKIGTRFADARTQAVAAVEALSPGDAVAVYSFGSRLHVVTPWTTDRDAAKKTLAALSPDDRGTDLAEALRQLQDALAARAEPVREIRVFSDLQARGWENYVGDWQLPHDIGLFIVDVPTGRDVTPPNVGIVALGVPAQAVVGSQPEVLTARVRNYTDTRREVAVHLRLGDEEIDKRQLSLAPESESSVSFRHEFDSPGEVDGRFVLSVTDEFPPDDRAGFIVQVKPKIRVVLVNGSTDADPRTNDGFYLKRAFEPSRESIFQVMEVTPAAWDETPLAETGVVVLTDVTDLSADGVRKLERYVQEGGGVMFFVGTRTEPDAFNRLFAGVAPCRLGPRTDLRPQGEHPQGLVVAEVDYRHPIFREFAKPHHGDFSRVSFESYFTVTESQAAQVLARFDNRKPAVLFKRVGKGASLLVVSSADLEMGNFPLRGVFLPFVHESARLLSAFGVTRETQAHVGDEIVARLPQGSASARLTSPSGVETELDVEKDADADSSGTLVRFEVAEQGVYRLSVPHTEQAGDARWLYAVNIDPAEGDLVKMQRDEIAAALTTRRGTDDAEGGTLVVEGRATSAEDVEAEQQIGWMLLVAAATLLAAEMWLARRIAIQE